MTRTIVTRRINAPVEKDMDAVKQFCEAPPA